MVSPTPLSLASRPRAGSQADRFGGTRHKHPHYVLPTLSIGPGRLPPGNVMPYMPRSLPPDGSGPSPGLPGMMPTPSGSGNLDPSGGGASGPAYPPPRTLASHMPPQGHPILPMGHGGYGANRSGAPPGSSTYSVLPGGLSSRPLVLPIHGGHRHVPPAAHHHQHHHQQPQPQHNPQHHVRHYSPNSTSTGHVPPSGGSSSFSGLPPGTVGQRSLAHHPPVVPSGNSSTQAASPPEREPRPSGQRNSSEMGEAILPDPPVIAAVDLLAPALVSPLQYVSPPVDRDLEVMTDGIKLQQHEWLEKPEFKKVFTELARLTESVVTLQRRTGVSSGSGGSVPSANASVPTELLERIQTLVETTLPGDLKRLKSRVIAMAEAQNAMGRDITAYMQAIAQRKETRLNLRNIELVEAERLLVRAKRRRQYLEDFEACSKEILGKKSRAFYKKELEGEIKTVQEVHKKLEQWKKIAELRKQQADGVLAHLKDLLQSLKDPTTVLSLLDPEEDGAIQGAESRALGVSVPIPDDEELSVLTPASA